MATVAMLPRTGKVRSRVRVRVRVVLVLRQRIGRGVRV